MSQLQVSVTDPFALMMNPEAVLEAMHQSQRLGRLQRRICRPLDRVVTPVGGGDAATPDAHDDADGDDFAAH